MAINLPTYLELLRKVPRTLSTYFDPQCDSLGSISAPMTWRVKGMHLIGGYTEATTVVHVWCVL